MKRFIIPLFFSFILILTLFASVISGYVPVSNTTDSLDSVSNRIISVDSNGVLHALHTSSTGKLYYNNSVDNGITWSVGVLINGSVVTIYALCVDGDNDIYILYETGGRYPHVNHSDDSGVSWNAEATWKLGDFTSVEALAISLDANNNVICSINYDTGNDLILCFKYMQNGHSWTSFLNVYNAVSNVHYLDIAPVSNGSFYIVFSVVLPATGGIGIYYVWVDNLLAFHSGLHLLYYASSNTYDCNRISCVVDFSDNVHVVYMRENNNAIMGLYYNTITDVVSGTEELIYRDPLATYSISSFSLSMLSIGNMEIIFSQGDSLIAGGLHGIKRYYGSSGAWVFDGILTIGNDDQISPFTVYQRYPTTCILTSGYSCIYRNNTDNQIIYIDSGTLSWYGGGGEGGVAEGEFYLRFFDLETGRQMAIRNSIWQLVPACSLVDIPLISASIGSDLWISDYGIGDSATYYDVRPINATFNDGDLHTITISGLSGGKIHGCYDNARKLYQVYSRELPLYHGQTYNIYLVPVGYSGNPDYISCYGIWWPNGCLGLGGDDYFLNICSDAVTYEYGDTMRIEYKFPSLEWMINAECLGNMPRSGWQLMLFDDESWLGELNTALAVLGEQDDGDFFFNDQYNTMEWVVDTTNGYFENYHRYKIKLANPSFGALQYYGLTHYCNGNAYTPNGNIISISPNPAYLGQEVAIVFNASAGGQFDIYFNDNEYSIPFSYYNGNRVVYYTPLEIGVHQIFLNIDIAGQDQETVDQDLLTVTGDSSLHGEVGFNSEYLQIFGYRHVAGANESVNIIYRCLSNTSSLLRISSPRGENTSYSTMVNKTGRLHSFKLPSNAPIGVWEVTLFGNSTHTTNFSVISEENNWVEFVKNSYDQKDSYFSIKLKHTYEVSLTFYKQDKDDNWIAQGTSWRLNSGQYSRILGENGLEVPSHIVQISKGVWKVELWRINQENKLYILATDECIVVDTTVIDLGLDGSTLLPIFDPMIAGLLGLLVTLICLFVPIIAVSYFGKALNFKVDIPPTVYAMSGGAGTILCVFLGFWDWTVPFFIISLGIIVLALSHYIGKPQQGV